MITVGAFEAKTHLSSLLERVAKGEEIVITRHGKPLARLIPVAVADRFRIDQAISKLNGFVRAARLAACLGKSFAMKVVDDGPCP
jgi:prevent-host-death family protein